MNNNEIYKSVVICIISFLFIFSGTGFAGTARITPDKSIQDAIYKSQPGDIIEIESGTYFESVVVTKPLVIRGVDTGSGIPTINAKGKGSAIALLADGVSLEDLNFQGASGWDEAGILMKSNGCTVLNCTSSNNVAIGIYLVGGSNNILINNQAFNCNFGIALNLSSNNTLRNNTMQGNMNNFLSGYSSNDIDTSNKIEGRPLYYLTNKTDIVIDSSSNAADVYCIDCSNITIKDLTIEHNFAGIYFQNTSDSHILNNSLRNNSMGIFFVDSEGNYIEENTLTGNAYGIYLRASYMNCANNTISLNNASKNDYGIFLNIEGSRGQSNLIFNNTLIGNKKANAYSRGQAKWDNGSAGNRYSDYDELAEGCNDSDLNGFCDSPYKIRGGPAVDRHPIFGQSK